MFAKRLKWFVIMMVVLAVIIVLRLVEIQIVRADQYETLADNMLTRPVRYLAAPRGSILDRNGQVLLCDEPASDISVRYEVLLTLLNDELPEVTRRYLYAVARVLRKRGRFPADRPLKQIVPQLRREIDALWPRLSELAGISQSELVARAERIRARVERIKSVVQQSSPTVREIAEQRSYQALLEAVDEDLALAVRIELETGAPWLRVVPDSRRTAYDADSLVHVMGRTGAASTARIENDPLAGDEMRRLISGDRCGVSGVERLAEMALRGTRGRIVEDFDRTIVEEECLAPIRGGDVRLTIDADLQREIQALLAEAVQASADTDNPAGGAAAVVLDVGTREVLALVSYPGYHYDEYRESYSQFAQDNRWQPLRFRAVANMYPPGSTCKVIALYGGLAEGVVTPSTQITCTGHLLPNSPNRFRCWIYKQTGWATHGPQIAEDAIRNSCNIYFFTVGDRLGVDRLCRWFSAFGLGRKPGTGLIEESAGIVPTSRWIADNRRQDSQVNPADAWNFAIGQGEVSATPLQCANVAATVASGRWEPVKLLRDNIGDLGVEPPTESIVFDEQYLRVLRTGMYRVVNERGGTAYRAKIDNDDYDMCGKTGSAQASRRVINKKYVLEWPDGRRAEVIASSRREALAGYDEDDRPQVVADSIHELFPPRGADTGLPSHAWFIAYTQPKNTPRGAAPDGPSYAICVLIEYGGSGGRVAGPVAKEIAELLVRRDK